MIVVTKFLPQLISYRYKKNQLLDLQESLERYCNVLPVFGFNSAKYDLNLIKSYLLTILVNERDNEPTIIKKANQFISVKFGDNQLLDIMNFLGGATSLDSFLKAYKTWETKRFFPYEWFDHPDKMQKTELPPCDAFYSKLCSCNPLEAEYTDYVNRLKSGLTTEQVVVKLKLSKPPPTGTEKYQYLQQIWKQEQRSSFKDFLRWYNKKDVVSTLEAMQKNCFLPRQRYRYVKTWLYFTKPGQHLLTQIYWCKSLSILGKRWRHFGKTSRRCCWWSIYRFYTQSSCWWNFYSKVYKHMQIYCWDSCQPTISLLDVSTHAYRSSYALEFRFRNDSIHTSTKQDPQLWKYGHVLFPTKETKMWNWKLLYIKHTEQNRLP